ncbi:MAG TPA: proline--tRNA ligase [Candidatus Hydrogenedentes bacterium]|mgnify:CR=1 FL=1|nr:proline--tRNA ligase [Candidatus Hydrogenedentota bacterium]
MRLSALIGKRFKERPSEAVMDSHAFLLRGGYARMLPNGSFALLPPGLRVLLKLKNMLHVEMDRIGGQEFRMPVVLPHDSPEESLVAGHGTKREWSRAETAVRLFRNEITSYAQLPFMAYQFQTGFRASSHQHGGLMNAREFSGLDAFSFHASQEDLLVYSQDIHQALSGIFAQLGLSGVIAAESSSGEDGNDPSRTFVWPCKAGEDMLVQCNACVYRATLESARGHAIGYPAEPLPVEKVHTPNKKTIDEVAGFLGVPNHQTAKVVFYDSDHEGKLVVLLIRGDLDVNDAKLAEIIKTVPVPADERKILAAGSVPGFASPMGLDRAKIRLIVDHSIAESNNLVAGANEEDYHIKNFNLARDLAGVQTVDVAQARPGDGCPHCDGQLAFHPGIALGQLRILGTSLTRPLTMTFLDEKGLSHTPVMGHYHLDLGRLFMTVMEAHHDDFGPQWPMAIAPWTVHVNALKFDVPEVKSAAEDLYAALCASGIDVLFDDRNERPGVQFADADLLGAPIRIIISERNLKNGQVEFKRRDTGESGVLPLEAAVMTICGWASSRCGDLRTGKQ